MLAILVKILSIYEECNEYFKRGRRFVCLDLLDRSASGVTAQVALLHALLGHLGHRCIQQKHARQIKMITNRTHHMPS